MKLTAITHSRFISGFFLSALLFGTAAFAVDAVNTPETGYVLCINNKTKVVTFPGKANCPKGNTRLLMGAQGLKGEIGATGATGAQGVKGDTGAAGPATPATLKFVSAEQKGPIPTSGSLPTYTGTSSFETILSLTVPSNGTYWASFSTETWQQSNQTNSTGDFNAGKSFCESTAGNIVVTDSANQITHTFNTLIRNLVKGELVILRCAQIAAESSAKAWRSSGYLLRVDD